MQMENELKKQTKKYIIFSPQNWKEKKSRYGDY